MIRSQRRNPINQGRAKDVLDTRSQAAGAPFTDTDAYRNIKVATEAFVMANCGFLGDRRLHAGRRRFHHRPRRCPDRHRRFVDLARPISRIRLPGAGRAASLSRRHPAQDDRRSRSSRPISATSSSTASDFNEPVSNCYGILRSRLVEPCLLELIWSYWQEEGMLVQTMNADHAAFPEHPRAAGRTILSPIWKSTRCGRSTTCSGVISRTSSTA